MSDVPATTDENPTGLATIEDNDLVEGLEDFDTTDYVMPRLNIDHKTAEFVDSLSGERFKEIQVVLLGLVKQRILWDADVKDDAKPLCKSFNHDEGHPDPATFPWMASGFDKAKLPESGTLPCAGCKLKEWGSGRNDAPWCSEQFALPLMMDVAGDMTSLAPALLTVQRSAIKPTKAYLTAYGRSKTPLFTALTKITLTAQKRGNVDYAVPAFSKGGPTDEVQWPQFIQQFRSVKGFITSPPVRRDDKPVVTEDGAAKNTTPLAEESPDDLPF